MILLALFGRYLPAAEPASAPPTILPEVVVTGETDKNASLISPGAATAGQRLQSIPGAIDIAIPHDFQQGRGAYLEDFLPNQPGLLIQSAQGSEDTKLSIRGSGVQDDDIIGVGILIDGVPLNQGDGEAFLGDLDLRTVKYAEIYRGADALRYGAATLGGALNFVTLTGRDADPLTLRASFGSYGFTEQAVTSGVSSGRTDAYISFLNHTLDGYRTWSQENMQKAFFSLGYRVNENVENRLYFFFGHLDQNNPSSLTKDELYRDPRQTDPEAIQEKWGTHWTYERLMDRLVIRGDEWQWQLALAWNHRQELQLQEYEDDFRLGATRYYSDDYAADIAFESNTDLKFGKNRFSMGFLPAFEPESDSAYANPNGRLEQRLGVDRTYSLNLPIYVENQLYFGRQMPRFSLLTGVQGFYAERIFKDRFRSATLGDQSHENHFLALNPKVGVAYEWKSGSLAYANISRSFQPPSFDEATGIVEGVDGGRIYNDLHAQKAITVELGTRGEAGPFSWDVAIYRSWVRDELLDQNNSNGQPLGTVNAPRTMHQGIEAGLETELFEWPLAKNAPIDWHHRSKDEDELKSSRASAWLVIEQTFNFSDFRFSGDAVYGDNRIAGTPVEFYKAQLRYERANGLYFGPNIEWNILKYPVDEANSLFADPYALLGFRIGYKNRKGFQVYFEAKNLPNKIYAATVEPIADARTGADTDSFNPGNGRAYYGGISFVW